eukprot:10232419-Heterocapsa_arctica.AAC.1
MTEDIAERRQSEPNEVRICREQQLTHRRQWQRTCSGDWIRRRDTQTTTEENGEHQHREQIEEP